MRWFRVLPCVLLALVAQVPGAVRADPPKPGDPPRGLPLRPAPAPPGAGAQHRNRWALIIGISAYQEPALSLRFADRDAKALYDLVTSPRGGGFPAENIKLLLNEQATGQAIRNAFTDFLTKPGPEDFVLIHVACHGGADPRRPDVINLWPYDVARDNVAGTSIRMSEIKTALADYLEARRAVLLLDTCHAAALTGSVGARGPRADAEALHRYLQSLGESKPGWAVLTAAHTREVALEDERWGGGHGVFTWHVLEGLRGQADHDQNGMVTTGELFSYVTRGVEDATGRKQHPTPSGDAYDADLVLSVTSGEGVPDHSARPVSAAPSALLHLLHPIDDLLVRDGYVRVEGRSLDRRVRQIQVNGADTVLHDDAGFTAYLPAGQRGTLRAQVAGLDAEGSLVAAAERSVRVEPDLARVLKGAGDANPVIREACLLALEQMDVADGAVPADLLLQAFADDFAPAAHAAARVAVHLGPKAVPWLVRATEFAGFAREDATSDRRYRQALLALDRLGAEGAAGLVAALGNRPGYCVGHS